jgi:hypothetical protein
MSLIEAELARAFAGFLAIHFEGEIIKQYATAFLYLDKNIFIPADEDDDILDKTEKIKSAAFTIIRNNGKSGGQGEEGRTSYRYISIKLDGLIKKTDDQRLAAEVNKAYNAKYHKGNPVEKPVKFYIIDTEEFQAFEETGEPD